MEMEALNERSPHPRQQLRGADHNNEHKKLTF
jgi:hypothetical protein